MHGHHSIVTKQYPDEIAFLEHGITTHEPAIESNLSK